MLSINANARVIYYAKQAATIIKARPYGKRLNTNDIVVRPIFFFKFLGQIAER